MSVYESEATMNVLLDVAAQRRKEEEMVVRLGLSGIAETVKDGLQPDRKGDAMKAIVGAVIQPTWSNSLLAQALVTTTCAQEENLREYLVKLVALAVAWIENIDARKKDSLG